MSAATLESSLAAGASRQGEWLLRAAEYIVVKGQFLAPGWHRARIGIALSAGLAGGRATMNVISGQRPDGTEVHKENVLPIVRPFVGLMQFNPSSDDPRDRWKHVVDTMAPGIAGAAGVIAASRYHFADRISAAHAAEEIAYGLKKGIASFEQIEQAIAMNQARAIERWTGVSALKGAASGSHLTPGSFGVGLSSLFGLRSDRKAFMGFGKFGEWFNGTTANSPHGHAGNIRELWKHRLANPDHAPHELHELENLSHGVAKAILKSRQAAHIEPFTKQFLGKASAVIKALRGESLSAEESAQLSLKVNDIIARLHRTGEAVIDGRPSLDKELVDQLAKESWNDIQKLGLSNGAINPKTPLSVGRSLRIGENGIVGKIAEFFDWDVRRENNALRKYYATLTHMKYNGASQEALEAFHVEKPINKGIRKPRTAILATGAGFAGLAAYGATHSRNDGLTPIEATYDGHAPDGKTKPEKIDRLAHFANGTPLTTAEWTSNTFNFPPSKHRAMTALGFFTGTGLGMKVGDVLTGMTLTGAKADLRFVPKFMEPVVGLLRYDFHAADVGNRWAKVAHYSLPAIGGFAATKLASDLYFNKRRQDVANDNDKTIDRVSEKISFDQSGPWSYLMALTSLANVGTGLPFLPFSFGMNLGTRFSLGNNRKVILPGVKEVWSNNYSREPYGPATLLHVAINYITNNPSREPEILVDRCDAILSAWFGQQPHSTIQRFADDMLAVRDKYYRDGGVPKTDREACRKELEARFTGVGLHDEFAKLGLDVLKAHLGDNGLSGDIGNWLGARRQVNRDIADFRAKEFERRAERQKESPVKRAPAAFADRVLASRQNDPSLTVS